MSQADTILPSGLWSPTSTMWSQAAHLGQTPSPPWGWRTLALCVGVGGLDMVLMG